MVAVLCCVYFFLSCWEKQVMRSIKFLLINTNLFKLLTLKAPSFRASSHCYVGAPSDRAAPVSGLSDPEWCTWWEGVALPAPHRLEAARRSPLGSSRDGPDRGEGATLQVRLLRAHERPSLLRKPIAARQASQNGPRKCVGWSSSKIKDR